MEAVKALFEDVKRIRKERPLVHNITNYVVMNSTANALLALGAAPVMAHAFEEVEEMVGIARALVLNIGTLSTPWVASMRKAAEVARERGIPMVLDPVGAGATSMRTATALHLVQEGKPAVVRGNASEILSLHGTSAETKGVESTHESDAAALAARDLAAKEGCVVSVSGVVDYITDGEAVIEVLNGHPMMPRVTGMGCTAAALTGAFAAVNPSALEAAANAMAVMGIAGEVAGKKAEGPGTFQVQFFDALYRLDQSTIRERLKMKRT